jgi:hypothetical protein
MNITFDKTSKQFVWNLVKRKVENRTCPFCGTGITAKNFAGAMWLNEEFRAFDGSLICLIALTDQIRTKVKPTSRFHIHWFKPIGYWTGYIGIKRCRCGEERTFDIYGLKDNQKGGKS